MHSCPVMQNSKCRGQCQLTALPKQTWPKQTCQFSQQGKNTQQYARWREKTKRKYDKQANKQNRGCMSDFEISALYRSWMSMSHGWYHHGCDWHAEGIMEKKGGGKEEELTMDVLRLCKHLQGCGDIIHTLDIQVQQIEGLNRDAGFGPGRLHGALNSPSKDLAGQRPTTLYIFFTSGHIALAFTSNVLPVFIIGGVGSRAYMSSMQSCRQQLCWQAVTWSM